LKTLLKVLKPFFVDREPAYLIPFAISASLVWLKYFLSIGYFDFFKVKLPEKITNFTQQQIKNKYLRWLIGFLKFIFYKYPMISFSIFFILGYFHYCNLPAIIVCAQSKSRVGICFVMAGKALKYLTIYKYEIF